MSARFVRRIVSDHGGEIANLESIVGHGGFCFLQPSGSIQMT